MQRWNTIARAALSGKTSIGKLVDSILADFDRIAVSQFIVKPVQRQLTFRFDPLLLQGCQQDALLVVVLLGECELLIGKALFIYWPHSWNKIPYVNIPFPLFPNFARMGFVR